MERARPASPVPMMKPKLVEPKFPMVYDITHRSIPETMTREYICFVVADETLSLVGTHQ